MANYNLVVGQLHQVVSRVITCEAEGVAKDDILKTLAPAKALHSQAPFIHRCQTWPRGFPGDYETIEYLYHARNQAPADTIAYYCEEYALLSASTQQHRNKLQHQAQLVTRVALEAPAPVRILSLAGGSSLELQSILPVLQSRGADIELVLNDTDPEALDVARAALTDLGESCRTVPGNVVEVLAWEGDELGQFDLVLTGGLCDYLSDKHIAFLLRNGRNMLLKPGGTLFFTNIATGNPYRPWMEYLADWVLIERSRADIERLVQKAGFDPSNPDEVRISRDATRLTWLVAVTAPSQM